MSVHRNYESIATRVGDQVVVTDIEVTQKIVPAVVKFEDILAAAVYDVESNVVSIDFEGYDTYMLRRGNLSAVKAAAAREVAEALEDDGVEISREPVMDPEELRRMAAGPEDLGRFGL